MKCSSVCVVFVCVFVCCSAQRRPDPSSWGLMSEKGERVDRFLSWLILGCDTSSEAAGCPPPAYRHVEYPGYDGFYNNLARPNLGAIDTPLLRLLPPAYTDGVYQPVERPANPITVSEQTMKGDSGKLSRSGNTAFLLFFGQQVVEEVLDAQGSACPPEYFNIPIPAGHEYQTQSPKVGAMPLLRSRYDMTTGFSPNNPRQQLNEITPYIDGGLVYGAGKGWADVLRINANDSIAQHGKLASHSILGEGYPGENSHRLPFANPPPPTNHSQYVKRGFTANVNRFIKLGNPRGNENPFLLTFGIFWYRWHNVIAGFLQEKNPGWDGERVFNEARKWVIATQQAVTMYDWLPKYLKTDIPPYMTRDERNNRDTGGYDPTVDPQISQVFQSAAMRFGHTLVPSGVYLRKRESEGCETRPLNLDPEGGASPHNVAVRTCNSFWRSPELFTNTDTFEQFILGMSSQSTEEEDNIIVEDLRGRVFGPLEFSRRDLMAVNIQRAREHGLPDYETARKAFGLPPLRNLDPGTFREVTGTMVPQDVLQRFQSVYNDTPSQVDIWPGGLMETRNGPGQLFSSVIQNQFERIRSGDRFWFENKRNELFSAAEISRIKDIKIIDLLLCVGEFTLQDIQEDPFTAPRPNNMPTGTQCQQKLTTSTPCTVFMPSNMPSNMPSDTSSNMSQSSPAGAWWNGTCKYLPPLSSANLEACSPPKTYDYFTDSIVSYIVTFLCVGLSVLAISIGVNSWVFLKETQKNKSQLSYLSVSEGQFKCKEKVSFLERRVVTICFDESTTQILVKSNVGKVVRVMELAHLNEVTVYHTENLERLLIRAENHYDLYILTETSTREKLLEKLTSFCESAGKEVHVFLCRRQQLNSDVITFKHREEQLKYVLEAVLAEQNREEGSKRKPSKKLSSDIKASKIQLTKSELANALGMTVDNAFFKQFFYLMDKDMSGFVTFQEFMNVMVLFTRGTEEEKARLFFCMYDLDHSGFLTSEDFAMFIQATSASEVQAEDRERFIASMLDFIGLKAGDQLSFENFYQLFQSNKMLKTIGTAMVGKTPVSKMDSIFSVYGYGTAEEPAKDQELESEYGSPEEEEKLPASMLEEQFSRLSNYIKSNEKFIFWWTLYTIVMILVFAERAYYYSVEREHAGLRRIAGYGVTVTRGAASAMMFTYSSLLVTMYRNIFAVLRSTFIHKYFPFDDMIQLHKYIAWWALFWTVIHVVGHAINFYHISTQTASDLLCIFRNFFRSTHALPKFHYWCWETVTGFTGIALTVQVAIIYIFAVHARKHIYKFFWLTHNTYPIFYFLMILHGTGQLVQPPFFHLFFLGPCILFAADKIISISRKNIKIAVIGAKHLPSNVIQLRIQRPVNFSYASGQWIRIASSGISSEEFHPFTLSSAPHERDLTLHIRGVGPWTNRLRKVYPDCDTIKASLNYKYPQVAIDGPFGEGHQNWGEYETVVLVGGGIGVTPFASILKDIAFKSNQAITHFKCKKVIFLWVTRSQKQFEWMTEMLRQVEERDMKNLITVHIFITQFKSKYDFRTTMLYHAERHFQKLSGKSMFTGLRAVTHFSRPDFVKVFEAVKRKYSQSPIIGVFTCGSLALSSSVDAGCREVNKGSDPILKHYYENF